MHIAYLMMCVLALQMEKLEDLIVHLMQQINGWQNSVIH